MKVLTKSCTINFQTLNEILCVISNALTPKVITIFVPKHRISLCVNLVKTLTTFEIALSFLYSPRRNQSASQTKH